MAILQDSGQRTSFETGAVRDSAEGKGRCDLLPLEVVSEYINWNGDPSYHNVLGNRDGALFSIEQYIRTGDIYMLYYALDWMAAKNWDNRETMILEISIQYEDGMQKYGERNWEKGINLHNYMSSAIRHYLKFLRGDKDEPHDRAFGWNILGAIWTHKNMPELINLPFMKDYILPKYCSNCGSTNVSFETNGKNVDTSCKDCGYVLRTNSSNKTCWAHTYPSDKTRADDTMISAVGGTKYTCPDCGYVSSKPKATCPSCGFRRGTRKGIISTKIATKICPKCGALCLEFPYAVKEDIHYSYSCMNCGWEENK